MDIKTVKYKDDECYGQSFEQIDQCKKCWIKDACYVAWKNRDK